MSPRSIVEWGLGIITVLGFLIALLVFWPRMTVQATSSPDNPSAVYFVITNTSFLIPLTNVDVAVGICFIQTGQITFSGNCNDWKVLWKSPQWKPFSLAMDDSQSIDIREIFDTYGGVNRINGGDIAIVVRYSPWIIPLTWQRDFPFVLKTGNDGGQYWAPHHR